MMFFPITALLVLVGIRFDAVAGILIMFMVMPAHLLFSFFVVRTLFRSQLERFARKKKYAIFNIPADRQLGFAFVFMAVPGLPYAVKNYLLPISNIPFREYFLISWLVNSVMGIPFVMLGHAASKWNIQMILILIVLLGAAYFIAQQVRKRYAQMVQSTTDR
ncbi:MAG: VTT domain-containing protein [Desulfosarcina sp.]|nr:VTT domain-containing protein [Desulfosarcina sp.]